MVPTARSIRIFTHRRGYNLTSPLQARRSIASMATYRGRKNDICRTVGFNIWGQPKCPSTKRPYPAGQHGPNLKERRQSEYGEQLLAKQTIRRYYNMLEKQFSNTFSKAQRMSGNT